MGEQVIACGQCGERVVVKLAPEDDPVDWVWCGTECHDAWKVRRAMTHGGLGFGEWRLLERIHGEGRTDPDHITAGDWPFVQALLDRGLVMAGIMPVSLHTHYRLTDQGRRVWLDHRPGRAK